jgi:hypothetical protein
MAEPVPPGAERDPHFIGWLPMPRAYARFLVPVAAGLVVAAAVTAALIARGQRSPGDGRWADEQANTLVGIVYAEPYAMIRVPGTEPGDPPVTILLVEEGKFGAKARVRPFDGQSVQVTGTLLSREGIRMLELVAGEDGLRRPTGSAVDLRRPAPQQRGRVTLRGEIVDSKCYLGAMKPGGGRTHKGCATLCLKGGVPPLFVARGAGGELGHYLLTDAAGGPLDQATFDLVGEQLECDGELEVWGDFPMLKAASTSFRRR